MGKKAARTYREAADEIEEILAKIEEDQQVDIDELAERVERAAKLIQFCFDRLRKAEMRVEKVTRDLTETATPPEEGDVC